MRKFTVAIDLDGVIWDLSLRGLQDTTKLLMRELM